MKLYTNSTEPTFTVEGDGEVTDAAVAALARLLLALAEQDQVAAESPPLDADLNITSAARTSTNGKTTNSGNRTRRHRRR